MKELLLLPVSPLRVTVWVADKVADEVDRQQFGSGAVVRQLGEIEEARGRGELDEDTAEELEGRVIDRQLSRAQPTTEPEEEAEDG
jgi:Gas vesicle protein G